MKERDEIKDLFSEKLRNHASEVSPKVWSAVSSQIGAAVGAPAAGTGISLAAKIIIGLGITAAATVGTIVALNSTPDPVAPDAKKQDSLISQQRSGDAQEMHATNSGVANTPTGADNTEFEMPQDAPFIMERTPVHPGESSEGNADDNTVSASPINDPLAGTVDDGKGILHERPADYTPEGLASDRNADELPGRKVVTAGPDVKEGDTAGRNETTAGPNGVIAEKDYYLELPNIFTPNGDRQNDVFTLRSEGLHDFSIVVMDRTNRVVFESGDPHFVWDGTYPDHTPVPDGTYVYIIVARDRAGNPVSKYNTVSISR